MTYKKAEVRVLGDAVTVIQSFEKVTPAGWDAIDMQFETLQTNSAYDLDE